MIDDDVGDIVSITFERGNANFIYLTNTKDYLEIADLSTIKQGYFPLTFTLSDGKDQTVYTSKLFVMPPVAVQEEPIVATKKKIEPVECTDPQLQKASADLNVSYISGSSAMKIIWNKF